jgi:hypothetical protein
LCTLALLANAAFAVSVMGIGDLGTIVCLAASAAVAAVVSAAQLRRPGGRLWRGALLSLATLALLAAPADASIDLAEEHASDANPNGSGAQYGSYLRAHDGGTRYETAASNPLAVVALIAADGRPVLIFRTLDGIQTPVRRLRHLVSEGAVRYAIVPHPCSGRRHCTPAVAWTFKHAVRVRPGLYRYQTRPLQR